MTGQRIVGITLVACGLLALAGTVGYPLGREGVPGPALFPRALAVMLACCGAWLAYQGAATPDLDIPPGRPRVIALTMLLLVVYVALWDIVPFVPRTAVLLLVFLRLLAVSWRGALLTAVLLSGVVFIVFERLLSVRL